MAVNGEKDVRKKAQIELATMAPDELARIHDLLKQAEQGDQSVVPEMKQLLDAHPEIWEHYGDLALHARESWRHLASASNPYMYEALGRKLDAMKAKIAGSSPTPLEELLVERIVICWLQVSYADTLAAQTNPTVPIHQSTLQKRQTSAQHRYLRAIQSLATVRKLLRISPSPMEIATKMTSTPMPSIRRNQSVFAGVPVAN